jgi:2-dehydropantoate 2-reductase
MKICVFGTGAVGGHVAVRLAKGGAEVSVVARPAVVNAIRARGLLAKTTEGDVQASVTATSDTRDLGPHDFVFVTAKAPSLPSVAAEVAPLPWWYFYKHGGPMDGRRLAQVDPGDAVWTAVGPERVIGAVVNTACTVVEPGVIRVASPINRFALGEPDGEISDRVEALAATMRAGGFTIDVTPRIREEILDKLIGNLCGVPIATLTLSRAKDVYAEPACVDAVRRTFAEVAAIAAALGYTTKLDIEDQIRKGSNLDHKPSMAQDLELGRPMEIDAMFTAPLALARELGVPTPTLNLLAALTTLRARTAGLYDITPARR